MNPSPHLRTSFPVLLHLSLGQRADPLLSTSRWAAVDADAADRHGGSPSGREAIYAQKEPNVANDVTKTYWGLAASAQSVAIMTETRSLHFSSPQKGRPRLSRARLCDARGGTISESTSSPRPPVQNARPTNRRSTRESPSSFLDTDCLLNFTTLRSVVVGRHRRRGHLSLSLCSAAPCESRFHLINFRFLHISSSCSAVAAAAAKSDFARFFIRSRQRHKTATTADAMGDWISLRFLCFLPHTVALTRERGIFSSPSFCCRAERAHTVNLIDSQVTTKWLQIFGRRTDVVARLD